MTHNSSNENAPALPENSVEMTVAKCTNVNQLALAILKTLEEKKNVRLVSIGANAINQATKACGKSRGMLAQQGIDVVWAIYFTDRKMTARPDPAFPDQPAEKETTLSAIVHQAVILNR